ncbi:hypothetical protein ACX9VS_06120 [Weissella paramesenteroides]
MKEELVKHVRSRHNIFNDIVREIFVDIVDVYRQSPQEVRQTKNRLNFDE